MPHRFSLSAFSTFLLALFCTASACAEESAEIGKRLQSKLDAFHAGQPANGETLKVIYFHPADNPPQPGYVERTERIMTDFSDFLEAEITRHGFTNTGIPFEKNDDGSLKIHLVTGSGSSDEYDYNYQTGQKIRMESQKALGEAIDFSNDFVFILCGLCQKRGENDYFFHSPYFGDGSSNQVRGLCYAADCEVLDPLNLTAEAAKIPFKYEEHSGTFQKNIARFNSWYLGGIAHELGHGLSLPHNGELPEKRDLMGRALMGGGNHTYGEDRWGGGKGTFLEFANAIRLSAHPLFTQSDKGRFEKGNGNFQNIQFASDGQKLTVTGYMVSTPPPLAMIAYSDPPGRDGYNAITWVSEVGDDGAFQIDIETHPFTGLHGLTIFNVKVNGAVENLNSFYPVSETNEPDVSTLNAKISVTPAVIEIINTNTEKAKGIIEKQLAASPTDETKRLLAHLQSLIAPPTPIALNQFEGKHISLSDAVWEEAKVGWGKPVRNKYFHTPQSRKSFLLELAGQVYTKGLYAHAPSSYSYQLDGKWKEFSALVGLQAGAGKHPRPRFTVLGDGKPLATSRVLKENETEELRANISGVQKLELKVESTIEGNAQCWTIWARPIVSR